MPALALFDALQDFGSRPQPVALPPLQRHEAAPAPVAPAAPPVDIDALVRREVARAEAELELRLRAEADAALEAERKAHGEALDALYASLGEATGALILERLQAMETRLTDLSAGTTARLLSAFLSDELQKRAVNSLAMAIALAIREAEAVRIEAKGPQSMLEALRVALGERGSSIAYAEASGFDLIVSIDGDLYETRLSEWSGVLTDLLA